jgi:hypothetical protein
MVNSSVYGILSLIILVVLIILYIYIYESDYDHDLKYKTYKYPKNINKENLFVENEEYYNINDKNAILIYGEIPNHKYWNITPYIDEECMEPITSLKYKSVTSKHSIAILITSNSKLCDIISEKFLIEKNIRNIKMTIVPIYIKNKYLLDGEKHKIKLSYTIMLKNKCEKIDKFNLRLYSSNIDVNYITEKIGKKKMYINNLLPNNNILSIWNKKSLEILNAEKHVFKKQILTNLDMKQDRILNISDKIRLKNEEYLVIIAKENNFSSIILFYSEEKIYFTYITFKEHKNKKIKAHVINPPNGFINEDIYVKEILFKENIIEIYPMQIFICS